MRMLLDDLRRFRASPEVQRLAVALFATAAVMLFAVASTSLPNPDQRDAAPQEERMSDAGHAALQDSGASSAVSAPTPLGCTKLYRGQWLRGQIVHKGDVEKLRLECFYGYGPAWSAM